MSDPDIFQYLDYRAYLHDWLTARKGRPSLRMLARRAKCSPALISAVTTGHRDLDTGRAETFAAAMKLDADQTTHMLSLVALAHDPSRQRRQRALDEALTTQRFRGSSRPYGAAIAVLSDPDTTAVMELARCDGWRDDPEWIARSLRPPISPEAAAAALTALQTVGALVLGEDGKLRLGQAEWSTGHTVVPGVASLANIRLHKAFLARAPAVLDDVPHDQRQFATMTFAVNAELVQQIKARVERFYEEIMHLVESSDPRRDGVYQLGMQFFPLAKPASLDGEDEPRQVAAERPRHHVDR
jgi:uncharacterized protein (TIGR02147 family)